jgi:integrase
MELTVLGTMLNWAVDPGKLIGSNPLAGFKPLKHHGKEGRALTYDEVTKLLDNRGPPWHDIWYTFLVTGIRRGELASLTFADIDWDGRELVIPGDVAKNHKPRRIPIDAGLWEILCRQRETAPNRQPGTAQSPKLVAIIRRRLSHDHVFVTSTNMPFDTPATLSHAFMRDCTRAGIMVRTLDGQGRVKEHVDLHSLRRTFATNLIANGADPKTVQEILGHGSLDMTMRIYTKIHGKTKRQAIGKLSYGRGALVPDHILEYPEQQAKAVQNGHKLVTGQEEKQAQYT